MSHHLGAPTRSLEDSIKEIDRLHALATKTAGKAVKYAKQVGQMLLQIKKNLPHGEFGGWITANLSVSTRQAQRYIAAAEGKKTASMGSTSKGDSVSHLTDEDLLFEAIENPKWLPESGYWYMAVYKNAAFHIVPDINYPKGFFISKLYTTHGGPPKDCPNLSDDDWDGESLYDGTTGSVDPRWIAAKLFHFGLKYPEKIEWKRYKRPGLERPFGEPENAMKKHHGD